MWSQRRTFVLGQTSPFAKTEDFVRRETDCTLADAQSRFFGFAHFLLICRASTQTHAYPNRHTRGEMADETSNVAFEHWSARYVAGLTPAVSWDAAPGQVGPPRFGWAPNRQLLAESLRVFERRVTRLRRAEAAVTRQVASALAEHLIADLARIVQLYAMP